VAIPTAKERICFFIYFFDWLVFFGIFIAQFTSEKQNTIRLKNSFIYIEKFS